jgi:hypothetical protein
MIDNLENEIWKDIEGYEGLYQISNMGRVKACAKWGGCIFQKEKLLKLHDNGKNYLYVDLYNHKSERRKYYIHRLVGKAFIDNPNNYPHINHKDENKLNNVYYNLEWCTAKYNCNYGNHNIKLSKSRKGKCAGKNHVSAISVICTTTGMVFDTITEAVKYYNIENLRSHISSWCNGRKKFNYLGKLKDGTKLKWMYYKDYLNSKNDIASNY